MFARLVLILAFTCSSIVGLVHAGEAPPAGFLPFGHLTLSGDAQGFWLLDQETGNVYRYDVVGNRMKRRFMGAIVEPGAALSPVEAVFNPAAVPRAHLLSLAGNVLEDVRMISSAVDQWAIEHNKPLGAQATVADLAPYINKATRLSYYMLRGVCQDVLGNPIVIPVVDQLPRIPKATGAFFSGIVTADFWIPFEVQE